MPSLIAFNICCRMEDDYLLEQWVAGTGRVCIAIFFLNYILKISIFFFLFFWNYYKFKMESMIIAWSCTSSLFIYFYFFYLFQLYILFSITLGDYNHPSCMPSIVHIFIIHIKLLDINIYISSFYKYFFILYILLLFIFFSYIYFHFSLFLLHGRGAIVYKELQLHSLAFILHWIFCFIVEIFLLNICFLTLDKNFRISGFCVIIWK